MTLAAADPILLARRRAVARARGKRRLALLAAVAAAGLGVGGYQVLRASPVFDVHTVAVRGGDARLDGQVQAAMEAAVAGRSLLDVDTAPLRRTLLGMPYVRSVAIDRAFPNTLAVTVVPERPVAAARVGRTAFAVAADGRVLGPAGAARQTLPLVTLPKATPMPVGATSEAPALRDALALVAATPHWFDVARIVARNGAVALVLRRGLELRLGTPDDLPLKFRVVARALQVMPSRDRRTLGYLDVSAPGRPALGYRH